MSNRDDRKVPTLATHALNKGILGRDVPSGGCFIENQATRAS
jgi:hypothetical protein